MQTRTELYDSIGYHAFEQKLDTLFSKNKTGEQGKNPAPRWEVVLCVGQLVMRQRTPQSFRSSR